jgi:hypothetical protein
MHVLLLLVVSLVSLTSCSGYRRVSNTESGVTAGAARVPNSNLPFIVDNKPACIGMVQDFCRTLFSPENQGSMRFNMGESVFDVRMGETDNDFDERDYEFLLAKLRAWPKLPPEFRETLLAHGFREKLRRHLARVSRGKMTLQQRIDNMRDEEEINSIWSLGLRVVVLTKMEKMFPQYTRIKEDFMPIELRYEAQRQRRMLNARVAKALWTDHPNWREVERKFEKVKLIYKEVIQEAKSLPEVVRRDWLQRIGSVDLVIPGADPEEDLENCSKNEANAYYLSEKNYITVCAGDFNTEEIEQTLAHEMGHALDLGRSRFIYVQASALGEALGELKERSCGKQPFSCEHWQETKAGYLKDLGHLRMFKPQLPDFNICLQEKKVDDDMPEEYIQRVAKEEVEYTVASLARRNVFLRIISPEIPMPDGKNQRNPMYMNPCGYYLWETQAQPLDDDVSLLLFFTAEYRCSKIENRNEKFRQSIEVAKAMQHESSKATIRMEGEFSARTRLNRDGYASAPTERFADNLGQLVFARLLKEETDVRKRRARYLTNNAWLCRQPGIQALFPGEANIQRSYYVEAHSEIGDRQKELLSEEIREVLDCKADFTPRHCEL